MLSGGSSAPPTTAPVQGLPPNNNNANPHLSRALFGVDAADFNNDGRPDLYVANDEDPNLLYINEPGGPLGFHFVEASKAYRIDNA